VPSGRSSLRFSEGDVLTQVDAVLRKPKAAKEHQELAYHYVTKHAGRTRRRNLLLGYTTRYRKKSIRDLFTMAAIGCDVNLFSDWILRYPPQGR